jgi:hypothetical protein
MVCSARPARCGPFSPTLAGPGGASVSDVLLALLVGSVIGYLGIWAYWAVAGPGVAGAEAAAAGALAGLIAGVIAWLVLMTIITVTVLDRCMSVKGRLICATGAVLRIVENSSLSGAEAAFPFTMMHDRVDVVTRSGHWEDIERDEAFVFCTTESVHHPERISEILRCYYYDPQVCSAGVGAIVGGGVLGAAGLIAGTLAAAAIGCLTVFLCILAVLIAVIIVVMAVILGAIIGSAIGRAAGEDRSPRTFVDIDEGSYVAVWGNLRQRGFDLDANVLWWTGTTHASGMAPSNSHCELDEHPNMC